jgi:hypothetical protein
MQVNVAMMEMALLRQMFYGKHGHATQPNAILGGSLQIAHKHHQP